ncbi:hypothetical protein [Kitasatospora sp. NPDC005856]
MTGDECRAAGRAADRLTAAFGSVVRIDPARERAMSFEAHAA